MRMLAGALLLLSSAMAYGQSPEPLVQELRREAGLSQPAWNPGLSASSAARASVLAASGILSHTDAEGRRPGTQMLAEGFPPGEYGEILGAGLPLAAVWEAWLKSPSHRAVLTGSGWTLWGWGRADREGVTVWVLRFYRP